MKRDGKFVQKIDQKFYQVAQTDKHNYADTNHAFQLQGCQWTCNYSSSRKINTFSNKLQQCLIVLLFKAPQIQPDSSA